MKKLIAYSILILICFACKDEAPEPNQNVNSTPESNKPPTFSLKNALADDSISVKSEDTIKFVFNDFVVDSSVNGTNFGFLQSSIPGTIVVKDSILCFIPLTDLPKDTVLIFTIGVGIETRNGNRTTEVKKFKIYVDKWLDIRVEADKVSYTLTGALTSNTTFKKLDSSGKQLIYILDGEVYVPDGITLTLEPGVIVKGKTTPSSTKRWFSALVVSRGGKIIAEGTATDPIVFTGTNDPILDVNESVTTQKTNDFGFWGGLVLLGKAPQSINGNATATIEGFTTSSEETTYGGTESADNSGVLKYVSIRHTGANIGNGNEIQGLTLGGVGSGTTIDYVEVFASGDDGVEVLGGTVKLKHFAVAFAADDMYDFDQGWRGQGQYMFGLQSSATLDADSRVGEWDGAIPDGADLYSKPDLANLTLVAAGEYAASEVSFLHLRDAFGGNIINSIFTDFKGAALEVEDLANLKGVDSYDRLLTDDMNILGNVWYTAKTSTIDASSGFLRITQGAEFPTAASLVHHLTSGNNTALSSSAIMSLSVDINSKMLDPRPVSHASIISKFAQDIPSFSLPAGIEATSYKGAFDPNGTNWLKGWTALDKYGLLK